MKTTAQDIMSTEVATIREGSSIEEALKLLINSRITGVPVVNAKGEMIGVLSEYDIMVQLSGKPQPEKADLMVPVQFSAGAQGVSISTGLDEIIDLFIRLKYRRLPVVDQKKKLVGIITRRDLMRLFYYRARLT